MCWPINLERIDLYSTPVLLMQTVDKKETIRETTEVLEAASEKESESSEKRAN